MSESDSPDSPKTDAPAEAESTTADTSESGSAAIDPQAPPQINILAHFVRDLSFENVAAIEGVPAEGAQKISVQVNLDGQNIGDDRYQVNMKINARATAGEATRFLVELEYTGVFSIKNAPETHLHPLMFIECPRLLLPFARRVVSDVTRDGGFPPLMLDNVDFGALYRQKLEQIRQQRAERADAGGVADGGGEGGGSNGGGQPTLN